MKNFWLKYIGLTFIFMKYSQLVKIKKSLWYYAQGIIYVTSQRYKHPQSLRYRTQLVNMTKSWEVYQLKKEAAYWHNSHYQNLVSFGKYLWKQVDNNSRGYDQPRVMSPGLIAQGVTLYSCTSALPFDLGSYLPWLYIYWSFQIDWSIKTEEIGLAGLFVICPRHF